MSQDRGTPGPFSKAQRLRLQHQRLPTQAVAKGVADSQGEAKPQHPAPGLRWLGTVTLQCHQTWQWFPASGIFHCHDCRRVSIYFAEVRHLGWWYKLRWRAGSATLIFWKASKALDLFHYNSSGQTGNPNMSEDPPKKHLKKVHLLLEDQHMTQTLQLGNA